MWFADMAILVWKRHGFKDQSGSLERLWSLNR